MRDCSWAFLMHAGSTTGYSARWRYARFEIMAGRRNSAPRYSASFSPGDALHRAVEYAGQARHHHGYALKNLTEDLRVDVDAPSGRRILDQRRPSLIRAMESAFAQCPAVAAKITFDTDQREVTIDYNPLWLERQKMTSPRMGGMEGGMKR